MSFKEITFYRMNNLQHLLRKKAIISNNRSSSNVSITKHQLTPGTTHNSSDADLSEVIPVTKIHHQKVSQRVIEKQQQQRKYITKEVYNKGSIQKHITRRKYITRRPEISKIIKVQGDLPSGRIEGRSHIQKVISVQDLHDPIQL